MADTKRSSVLDMFLNNNEKATYLRNSLLIILLVHLCANTLGKGGILLVLFSFPAFVALTIVLKSALEDKSLFSCLKECIGLPFVNDDLEVYGEEFSSTAYGTYLIICLYWVVYLFCSELNVSAHQFPLSILLHNDFESLAVNTMFLYAIGTVVEKRISSVEYLKLYVSFSLVAASSVFFVSYLFKNEPVYMAGASIGIASVMGFFAVRCYYKTVVFPVPLFCVIPKISPVFKLKIKSLTLIGLFFVLPSSGFVSGGLSSVETASKKIYSSSSFSGDFIGSYNDFTGVWLHLIIFLIASYIAHKKGLLSEADMERNHEIGNRAYGGLKEGVGIDEAEKSLKYVLERNPNDVESNLTMARIHSKHVLRDEGAYHYKQAIDAASRTDIVLAKEIFLEYYNKYDKDIESKLQYRIASYFHSMKDYYHASRLLDGIIYRYCDDDLIKEKALYANARICETTNNPSAAVNYYKMLILAAPYSELAEKSMKAIIRLNG